MSASSQRFDSSTLRSHRDDSLPTGRQAVSSAPLYFPSFKSYTFPMEDKLPDMKSIEDRVESTDNQPDVEVESKTEQSTRKVKDLLVFKSPSRPPIVMDRELYSFSVAVALLLSIIVAFFGDYIAIGLIWAVLFFIVALAKRPPEDVDHKITTEGITSMGHVYLWENLGPFWFTKKGGYTILHIIQQGYILGSLLIVLPQDMEQDKMRDTLAKYLSYIETPEKSRTDRITDWFTSKINKAKSSTT